MTFIACIPHNKRYRSRVKVWGDTLWRLLKVACIITHNILMSFHNNWTWDDEWELFPIMHIELSQHTSNECISAKKFSPAPADKPTSTSNFLMTASLTPRCICAVSFPQADESLISLAKRESGTWPRALGTMPKCTDLASLLHTQRS